ncbi:MAG TPA: PRC-barrel domain-containing protein [Thermomicrobiales bacterium]|nr:PRC-barrel domain-containing protein [Thermomicrobiales bacterium]
MRIDLGTDVFGTDGEKVGAVDKIVIDPGTKQIHQFVVHRGFLTRENKLVDIAMVSGQDDQGLRLDLTSDQVNELPDYIEERFVQVPEHDVDAIPFILPTAMGAGGYLYGAPYAGRGYEGRQDSFFDAAPSVAPVIEDESNIPETDVMISEGTDVYGADGDKVGSVGEVLVSENGAIQGFVVSKGVIFKKDVRVPIDWVESADEAQIRLNVTSAEAEAGAFNIEDSTL